MAGRNIDDICEALSQATHVRWSFDESNKLYKVDYTPLNGIEDKQGWKDREAWLFKEAVLALRMPGFSTDKAIAEGMGEDLAIKQSLAKALVTCYKKSKQPEFAQRFSGGQGTPFGLRSRELVEEDAKWLQRYAPRIPPYQRPSYCVDERTLTIMFADKSQASIFADVMVAAKQKAGIAAHKQAMMSPDGLSVSMPTADFNTISKSQYYRYIQETLRLLEAQPLQQKHEVQEPESQRKPQEEGPGSSDGDVDIVRAIDPLLLRQSVEKIALPLTGTTAAPHTDTGHGLATAKPADKSQGRG